MRVLFVAFALLLGAGATPAVAMDVSPLPFYPPQAEKPRAKPKPLSVEEQRRLAAVAYARQQVGKPYVWGAIGPMAFDCSGLIYAAYKHRVPRTSQALLTWGRRSKIRRVGDLLFRGPGHVGIYVGHGQAIHAPHAGSRVQYASVALFSTRRAVR
jgi:cell wall-associated NlpC family hydrolase